MKRWFLIIIISIIIFIIIYRYFAKKNKKKQILIEIKKINTIRNIKYDEDSISLLLSGLGYMQLTILLEYLQALQNTNDVVYINNLNKILIEKGVNIDEIL
jgi:hypothetical protein